jgi:hypothetical protein
VVVPGIDGTGETFGDLVAANVAATAWCTQVNAAAYSEICGGEWWTFAGGSIAVLGELTGLV